MDDRTKVFEKDLGTWDGDMEVVVQPGAPPQRSTGVMVNRVVGGRWLVAEMKNATTGFEGHGIYGWDETRGCYVGTWVDTMRTSLVIMEGSWDPAAREMTYRYELAFGGRQMKLRDVTSFIDDDTQKFQSFVEIPGQGPHAVVTATYRRRR